jgi:predicted XRE-type DNA-binding protein
MKERIKLIHGSGNVFRDMGVPNADLQQAKCLLAAEILKTLDRDKLTVRAAGEKTGIAAADFSRIRKLDLDRFTVDRLMTIVHRLGGRVEVSIKAKRAPAEART